MHYQEIKQRLGKANLLALEGKIEEAHNIVINTDGLCAADIDANVSKIAKLALRDYARKLVGDTDNGPE